MSGGRTCICNPDLCRCGDTDELLAWVAELAGDPEKYAATPGEVQIVQELADQVDPCRHGCKDPAAHAEGGHDV